MINQKKRYAINIASAARKKCEENKIIELDKTNLTIDDMKKIVNFFGGKLIESDKDIPYLEKTGEETYTIYYYPANKGFKEETSIIAILNALGIAFFEFDRMKENEIKLYTENGVKNRYDIMDQMLYWFSLEFLIPRRLFEKIFIKYYKEGVASCNNIANEFGINYMHIVCRADELGFVTEPSKSYVKK